MSVIIFRIVLFFFLSTAGALSSSCIFNVSKAGENYVFDLSRLNSHLENVTVSKDVYKESILYFSICGPLQISSSICMPGVLACVVKKNLTGLHLHIQNTGSYHGEKKLLGNNFVLQLDSNLQCHNNRNYSTEIQFRCSKHKESVKFLDYDTETCRYIIEWSLPDACPIPNPQVLDSCIFKDGKNIIDVRSLHHPLHYTFTENMLYEINICGPITSGNCGGNATACLIQKENNSTSKKIIGSYTYSKIIYEKGHLKIIYPADTPKKDGTDQTEINLICNYDSYTVQPKLKLQSKKEKKGNQFVFSVDTLLACMPEENKDCWFHTSGNKYDASHMHSPDENLRIPGPLNTTFLLHICGPLVRDSFWPGGGHASAALVNSDGTILNIGWHLKLSLEKSNETLFAEFKGGDQCSDNKDRRLMTKVKMSCSKQISGPVYLEYKNCVYIFEWKHPAVCPIKFAESSGCGVIDPVYGWKINLTANPEDNFHYEINPEKNNLPYNFEINLCSENDFKCNGKNDTSICLKKKNEEIIIGRRSSLKFRYESGGLFLTMTGDECKKGYLSKVLVEIFCDYSAPNDSKLEFSSEDENCNFNFKWFTKKVCPPRNATECSAMDTNGNLFDLSSLILNRRNYKVYKDNATFLLNVCGSLWYGKNETCPPGAGACLIEDNEFYKLGQVNFAPNFDADGQLTVKYINGRTCRIPTEHENHEHTKIIFVCDTKNLEPEYAGFNRCQHLFIWNTTLACSKKDYKREDHEPCMTYHPVTKFPFHFQRLKGRSYAAIGEDLSKYKISVCESLRETELCPNSSGVCGTTNSKQKVSYGSANDRLFYSDKHLYLNYTDGDVCDGDKRHYTVIEFSCCFKNCPPAPVSVAANGKCEHFVRWPTKFACEMVECAVNGTSPPRTYDLSVLRRFKTNYKINMTNTPAFINVCKTLAPVNGLNCPLEASSCVVNGTRTYSFGNSHTEPVLENNNVVLKYDHGSPCEINRDYNASSSYTFKCDRSAGVGLPVYEKVTDDCQYNFNWETSVVCPDTALALDKSNCKIVNQETGKNLDLVPIFKKGLVHAKSESRNYLVNLCLTAPPDKCSTPLCSVQGSSYVSYGDVKSINFSYNFNITTFLLTDGARCDVDGEGASHHYKTEIRLLCTDGMEDPDNSGWSAQENKCNIIIEFRSPAACFTDKDAASGTDGHTLRAILMSSISALLIILLGAILLWRFAGNSILKSDLLSMSFSRGRSQSDCSSEVVYTRVGATEEATLRLGGRTPDQPNETDSDEELLRVV